MRPHLHGGRANNVWVCQNRVYTTIDYASGCCMSIDIIVCMFDIETFHTVQMVPRGLEPRTLRLLAVRSNQLSYESDAMQKNRSIYISENETGPAGHTLLCPWATCLRNGSAKKATDGATLAHVLNYPVTCCANV